MDFEERDWPREFSGMNADEAAKHLTDRIMALPFFVKNKKKLKQKSSHQLTPLAQRSVQGGASEQVGGKRYTRRNHRERSVFGNCVRIAYPVHHENARQISGSAKIFEKMWKLAISLQGKTKPVVGTPTFPLFLLRVGAPSAADRGSL